MARRASYADRIALCTIKGRRVYHSFDEGDFDNLRDAIYAARRAANWYLRNGETGEHGEQRSLPHNEHALGVAVFGRRGGRTRVIPVVTMGPDGWVGLS